MHWAAMPAHTPERITVTAHRPLATALRWSIATLCLGLLPGIAAADQLRVVTWNTADDVSTNDVSLNLARPGMGHVLQAIGALNVDGHARPVDILALQESDYYSGKGINPTAQSVVNALNAVYGAGAYAAAPMTGTSTGNNIGNGPQTLVYRTSTVDLVSQAALGTPSGVGIARQVMEYEFRPAGGGPGDDFYLFNDHFKSGTTASDAARRGVEGGLVAGAANALGPHASIIYAGDYNPTQNTADPGYKTVIAGTGTNGNRAVDPLNPTNAAQNWSTSAFKGFDSESPATVAAFAGQSTAGIRYRDDFLLNSTSVQFGTNRPELTYIPNSYVTFGNTGTHAYGGAITSGSASAFASELMGFSPSEAGAVLTELTQVADHLPVVADYQIRIVPEPSSMILMAAGGLLATLGRSRRQRGRPGGPKPSPGAFVTVAIEEVE